jgi:hypothetical protein
MGSDLVLFYGIFSQVQEAWPRLIGILRGRCMTPPIYDKGGQGSRRTLPGRLDGLILFCHEPAAPIFFPTSPKVLLALVPSEVIPISAKITQVAIASPINRKTQPQVESQLLP